MSVLPTLQNESKHFRKVLLVVQPTSRVAEIRAQVFAPLRPCLLKFRESDGRRTVHKPRNVSSQFVLRRIITAHKPRFARQRQPNSVYDSGSRVFIAV